MKRDRIRLAVTAALLAWMTGVGAAGCIATGFWLDGVSMLRVAAACALAAALASVCFSIRHGYVALLCAAALACGFLWRDGTLEIQLPQLLYEITRRYNYAYGWPMVAPGEAGASTSVTYPVAVLGLLAAVAVSGVVCYRKSVAWALPASVLPLAACMVVTDSVPAESYLFVLMFALALLLMTDWTRRCGGETGTRLVWLLALPVALALMALFLTIPQDGYIKPQGTLQERLSGTAARVEERLGGIPQGVGFSGESGGRVNLRSAGKRVLSKQKAMCVTASQGGTIYLRGRDYDVYNGTGWESTSDRTESFPRGNASLGMQTVTVTTYGKRAWRYVPYYAVQAIELTGGSFQNEADAKTYTYHYAAAALDDPDRWAHARYLQLPPQTKEWAGKLVQEVTLAAQTREEKVRAIASFVRRSARYDLNTPRMPSDCDDFARWFLMESDTGYCVHFATSAVVLLRAAGIPARYVEGYMAECGAGTETIVTGESAHAWAEYFDTAGNVWRMLETTASRDDVPETKPQPTATAPETQAPDDETQPQPTAAKPQPTATAPETQAPDDETQPQPTAAKPQPTETDQTEPNSPDAPTAPPKTPGKTPQPGADQPGQTEPDPKEPFRLPEWGECALHILAWVAAVAAVLWVQSAVRIRIRRRRWSAGTPNEQAIARWGQCVRLARVQKAVLPQELEELALKARFSQHTLTDGELGRFDEFYEQSRRTLREKPLPVRTLLRVLYAFEC